MTARATAGRDAGPAPRQAAGYVAVPAHAHPGDAEAEVSAWRQALTAHAARHHLRLAQLFTDTRGRTETGLYQLIEHLRTEQAVAVVVPELGHLTHTPCLTGADLPTAQRFLHAQVLTLEARHLRLPLGPVSPLRDE